ncbi:MAG: cytochrome c oxidase subunit II [Acidobacteriaceae bacterium]
MFTEISKLLRRILYTAGMTLALPISAWAAGVQPGTNTFAPSSKPADEIFHLAVFTLVVTGGIFVAVGGAMLYAMIKFRRRKDDDGSEPVQVYGSPQIEVAWTMVPVLIVVVLFLTSARLIFAIQDAPKPQQALSITVVGHQFWWQVQYPKYGFATANEIHVPVGQATYIKLLSADVVHSFWIPELAGKTDCIPNHVNETWILPTKVGLYKGQCSQFCGAAHAKMLLRVYVDTPAQFQAWLKNQEKPAVEDPAVAAGREVFMNNACMDCHEVRGTPANGQYGPDLTHLASRATLGSGSVMNTPANLREWIKDPEHFKPGVLMPAMQLDNKQLDEVTAYLCSLR